MKIRTCPDFQFLFVKNKIRTCPDLYLSIEYLKSGLVQISYLDVSRFEIFDGKFWIWTCPNFNFGHVQIFFFQLKIWNLDLSRYQFWTSDSILLLISFYVFVDWSGEGISRNMFQQYCNTACVICNTDHLVLQGKGLL